jgi:RNA polymerase sigma-70 factor (ECF subfamily)
LPFTDDQLIGEIRAGSTVAFERLMGRYERLVYSIAYGFTGQREAALDVSQNVFLRVHSKLGTYKAGGNFKSWVARVAMNESHNWNRSQRRHRAEVLPEDAPSGPGATQEDRLWEREAWQLIHRSLSKLKPRHQLAVVLRYFEALPICEIAGVLGTSEGVVKSILFRSLRKMKIEVEASMEVA